MNEVIKKENDRKKKYLKEYLPLMNRVKILEEDIEQLRQSKMNPSVTYDDIPHGSNMTDLSDYVAVLDELEQRLVRAKYKRIKRYNEILQSIEQMGDDVEKNLLTLRYLRGLSWEKVCVYMSYEWAQIHRIHSKALEHFTINDIK